MKPEQLGVVFHTPEYKSLDSYEQWLEIEQFEQFNAGRTLEKACIAQADGDVLCAQHYQEEFQQILAGFVLGICDPPGLIYPDDDDYPREIYPGGYYDD